jgi:hypothetical protein
MTSEQHRLYGRHSNIPECCVEAYIKLVERYGVNEMPESYPSNAQYRVCEKCFRERATPAPLHICSEECRGFLSTFMPKWQVDLKLADIGSFTVAWRQKKRLAARVRRGVAREDLVESARADLLSAMFEFDFGPAPGVRPFKHLPEYTILAEDEAIDDDEYDADDSCYGDDPS